MQANTLTTLKTIIEADPTVTPEARKEILTACELAGRPRKRRLGNVGQAAAILDCHRRTVQRYAREGRLTPIYQSCRRVRFDLDEVERLANEGVNLRDGEDRQ